MTHALLALQAADTRADQIRHRLAHLPEQADVDGAAAAVARWEREVATRQRRLAELNAEIEADEAKAHTIDTQRERLSKQLKTVIAIREAEALQHELATLADQRSALDDAELEALEAQAAIDDELVALAPDEEPLRSTLAELESVRDTAAAALTDELGGLADGRAALRDAVEPALLTRYDALRPQLGGVAAAALEHSRCSGCHIDLTAGELDEVRAGAAAAGGVTECPNCGRLLVV